MTPLSALARQLQPALRMLLLLTVICGIAYPVVVLGFAQVAAHGSANGSLLDRSGTAVASSSLGQKVTDPQWFQGRRSASDYAGSTSGGSNLGPSSVDQAKALSDAQAALVAANPQASGPPPADALTASASGLDPDVSPEYAQWQVPRVAAARGLPVTTVQGLVEAYTKSRLLGFLGEPRVNVTALNLALSAAGPQ
ncbi:MAG: potassium-transporting ATPase subunit KdpC [Lapillicoccus sp.]